MYFLSGKYNHSLRGHVTFCGAGLKKGSSYSKRSLCLKCRLKNLGAETTTGITMGGRAGVLGREGVQRKSHRFRAWSAWPGLTIRQERLP